MICKSELLDPWTGDGGKVSSIGSGDLFVCKLLKHRTVAREVNCVENDLYSGNDITDGSLCF